MIWAHSSEHTIWRKLQASWLGNWLLVNWLFQLPNLFLMMPNKAANLNKWARYVTATIYKYRISNFKHCVVVKETTWKIEWDISGVWMRHKWGRMNMVYNAVKLCVHSSKISNKTMGSFSETKLFTKGRMYYLDSEIFFL